MSPISFLKRPKPKLGFIDNGYMLNFKNGESIWLTDSEGQQILAILETAQFIYFRGGAYQKFDIRSVVPHERKLTDDELHQNALLSTKEQNDKFRSLQRES